MVPTGAPLPIQLLDGFAKRLERGVVVEVARHEAESLGELFPHLVAEWRAGVLFDRLVDDLSEVLVRPVPAGEADKRKAWRQQATVGEVIDRRHQLLTRQIPGDTEDDQPAGPGDARQPPILRIPQRILRQQGGHRPVPMVTVTWLQPPRPMRSSRPADL